MMEVILSVCGIVVAVCVPVGLALINRMGTNLDRVHSRIDAHISNYAIHKTGA